MAIVFAYILAFLSQSGGIAEAAYRNVEWIFVHYHKTGHDFALKLAASFGDNCATANWGSIQLHKSFESEDNYLQTEIKVIAAPQMYFDWNHYFAKKNGTIVRIVHFVRDPFDVITAGYYYHAQIPTPASELSWEGNSKFNPCKYAENPSLSFISKQLSTLNVYNSSAILKQLQSVELMCKELVSMYREADQTAFNKLLENAKTSDNDVYDGIRLEAARSILAANNGDLLCMAINAIRENNAIDLSIRISTGDFSSEDATSFETTARKVFTFLMAPLPGGDSSFSSCLTVNEAVAYASRRAFPTAVAPLQSQQQQQGTPSSADREKYTNLLMNDEILAPVLHLVKSALVPRIAAAKQKHEQHRAAPSPTASSTHSAEKATPTPAASSTHSKVPHPTPPTVAAVQPAQVKQSVNKTVEWIFIHYHKTGHDVAHKLAASFSDKCDSAEWGVQQMHAPLKGVASEIDANIKVLAAPEMFFNWQQRFDLKPETVFRLVHFVRDPYDMVLAGYMYHAQKPTPNSELSWEGSLGYNPCQYTGFSYFARELASMKTGSNSSTILSQLQGVASLCNLLMSKYRLNANMTFNVVLQNAKIRGDVYEGVRLEAARSILSVANGDMLRMALNAIREDESPQLSRRVFSTDLPSGDLRTFDSNSQKLFEFLMASDPAVPEPFFGCMTVGEATANARKRVYLASESPGLLSVTQQKAFQTRLQKDAVLAPILRLVKTALNRRFAEEKSSSSIIHLRHS